MPSTSTDISASVKDLQRIPERTYHDGKVRVLEEDSLAALRILPDASVDAVVCDPPYAYSDGNGFMGSRTQWDSFDGIHAFQAWCQQWAAECLRVLKPGGHLLAFGATTTYHRLTCGIEDAGFEIRDCINWMYGQGWPKSLDVEKALLKGGASAEEASRWHDVGTALKPSHEPIVVARKPLIGTVAANVREFGTGGLNIGACRVAPTGESRERVGEASAERRYTDNGGTNFAAKPGVRGGAPEGRWAPNTLLDEDAAAFLDAQSGELTSGVGSVMRRSSAAQEGNNSAAYGKESRPDGTVMVSYGDTGGASRFFPVFEPDLPPVMWHAKASTSERPVADGVAHPTVKPLGLIRWLLRLCVPPGGVVLDPFLGSGTTAEAALLEGFVCVGCERDRAFLPLIDVRMERAFRPGTRRPAKTRAVQPAVVHDHDVAPTLFS